MAEGKIALTGCSGKIGGSTLANILKYDLIPATSLVVTTSAPADDAQWVPLKAKGIEVRQLDYSSTASQATAFTGCTRLLLVSSPRIDLDFDFPATTPGRESLHLATLEAALTAGVKHVYYTSLGFASDESKAGVMRAHNRTEEALERLGRERGLGWTSIREGLYNESWGLYLGHFDLATDLDSRDEVVIAHGGEGGLSWSAIDDLGLGTAAILADETAKWSGKKFVLSSTKTVNLQEVADLVGKAKGRKIRVKAVDRAEHERYYIEEKGISEGLIRWWASSYDALKDGEAANRDETLERILNKFGRKPVKLGETIEKMVRPS